MTDVMDLDDVQEAVNNNDDLDEIKVKIAGKLYDVNDVTVEDGVLVINVGVE